MKRLKLSAKDEKIKAESEKADAAPSRLDNWMKEQACALSRADRFLSCSRRARERTL
jgi:hypothetical protein